MRRLRLHGGVPPPSFQHRGITARDPHCGMPQEGSRLTRSSAARLPPLAMIYRDWVALVLARAALADADTGREAHAVAARFEATLGQPSPWLRPLAEAVTGLSLWHERSAPALAAHIGAQLAFHAAFEAGTPRVRRLILRPPHREPLPFALEDLALPPLPTTGDLAAWLELEVDRLAWLANPALAWRPNATLAHPPAAHYRCWHRPKASGGVRLIESPRPDLRAVQRRLLDGLLHAVPVHEACHGFVLGRSVVTHAAAHAGQAVVWRFDLRDFFGSVRAARVHALWRTLGHPVGVARVLTALTTTRTPAAVLTPLREAGRIDFLAAKRLAAPHLPQGAPTSPALANLCAFGLDLRLDGLAHALGATYTRYADDLVFSGPASLRRRGTALAAWVEAIATAEGFALQVRKTRVMPRHRAQRVGGASVNQHPNLPREQYDRLRALLHRCATEGPAAHNREHHADFRAHLRGRIAWAGQLNAARAAKLQLLFDRIDWRR